MEASMVSPSSRGKNNRGLQDAKCGRQALSEMRGWCSQFDGIIDGGIHSLRSSCKLITGNIWHRRRG